MNSQSQQFGESRQGGRQYFLDLVAPQISKITQTSHKYILDAKSK